MIEAVCWFDNDRGPLILLPREALPFWEGNAPPSDGRAIEAVSRWDDQEAATDYDRACDVMAWAEVLPVGPESWGLVVPEDAGGIAWLTPDALTAADSFALVQSLLIDTEALAVYRSLLSAAALDREGWTPLHDTLSVREGDLLLMHAASHGNEIREVPWNRPAQIGHAQVLRVPTGSYTLDQYILPDSESNGSGPIFTRFQPRLPWPPG